MQKTCTKCNQIKEIEEFYNEDKSWCRGCEKETARERRRKMSDKEKSQKYEREKRWREQNPDKVEKYKMRHFPPRNVLPRVQLGRGEWIYLKAAQEIMEAFDNRCVYCNRHRDEVYSLGFDHIEPYCSGGRATLQNLLPCCGSCNSSKNGKSIREYRPELEAGVNERHPYRT